MPAYEVFAFCAEASGTLSPWLNAWQAATQPIAGQHLAEAVAHWAEDLLADRLLWDTPDTLEDEQAKLAEVRAALSAMAATQLGGHVARQTGNFAYGRRTQGRRLLTWHHRQTPGSCDPATSQRAS